MELRTMVLGVVLVFVVALGGLTIQVTAEHGFDILSALSLLVLALFGFGIVGALRNPPR
jgi:hypothetical protein